MSEEITAEQAKKVLEDEERKNLEAFNQEFVALQKKYNVSLQVQQSIVIVQNAA